VLILRRRKLSSRDPCGRSSLCDLLAAPGSAGLFGIAKAARFPVVQAPLFQFFFAGAHEPFSACLDFLPSNRCSVPPRVAGAGFLVQKSSSFDFCSRFLMWGLSVVLFCSTESRFDLPSPSASCSTAGPASVAGLRF
jgi:hypothetical protein